MNQLIFQNWILQFRFYLALLGLGAGLSSHFFYAPLTSINTVILLIFLFLCSNLILYLFSSAYSTEGTLLGVIVFDLVLISAILFSTGGATNPFSILFLVYVVFAAILLSPLSTAIIVSTSIVAFGILLRHPSAQSHHHSDDFSSHLLGMWLAYILVAILSSFTVSVLSRLLKQSLKKTEELGSRQLRLSALTTLAAGAAHELRTPINTISLCVEDAKILIENGQDKIQSLKQLEIIAAETSRCLKIINDLGKNSGEIEGEVHTPVVLRDFINKIASRFSPDRRLIVTLEKNPADTCVRIPVKAVENSLSALIQNAFESRENPRVFLHAFTTSKSTYFQITDNGSGIENKMFDRLGEPFFTTKPAGKGMGLGIFLAKLTATSYGGNLVYDKSYHEGTRVTFSISNNS